MQTIEIALQRTPFFAASHLFESGKLGPGSAVHLVPEVAGPNAANALAARLRATGDLLGHLPNDLAPRYQKLALAGLVARCVVKDVVLAATSGPVAVRVILSVTVREPATGAPLSALPRTTLTADLPDTPGVYVIENTQSGRAYFASAADMGRQVARDLEQLRAGRHPNAELQRDFRLQRGKGLCASVVRYVPPRADLRTAEEAVLASAQRDGRFLYNVLGPGAVAGSADGGSGSPDGMPKTLSAPRGEPAPDDTSTEHVGAATGAAKAHRTERLVWLIVGGVGLLILIGMSR